MSKYEIKSNLSEKQIEADVASFFGWISTSAPFRLLDVDERISGADKKYYDTGFAFFMQFKSSQGLEPISKIPISKRKNRSKLEEIREFRHNNSLDDNPTLYFKLRDIAKTATDFQHNILLKYANTGYSQAFYVAPLHLDRNTYYNSLFNSVNNSNRYLLHPFYYLHRQSIFQTSWISYIGHIPYLKEHISIIPHQSVTTSAHYYSYSSSGFDLAWHSAELISELPTRLSDVLVKTILDFIYKDNLLSLDKLDDTLELEPIDNYSDDSTNPIERIQKKARTFYKNTGIRLVLFLTTREFAKYIKENT